MVSFKSPNVREELGEINRVAKEFAKGFERAFTEEFLKRVGRQSLTTLESSVWSRLENTDSYDIRKGDWKQVEGLASQVSRDWEDIKEKMEKGASIDAPIIIKTSNDYHLVSGNTRLMVARGLGVSPRVLIVDMSNFDNPELLIKREELETLKKQLWDKKKEVKDLEDKIKTLEREIDRFDA